VLPKPWWIIRSFLFGSDAPLQFQLSWDNTFERCILSALASPCSFPL
jgi:hypothetical protein